MVENPISFRDYVDKVREVLKDEFGEEFIEELSSERTIDEFKTYEAIVSDNPHYENSVIVSAYYDENDDLTLEVGQSISQAGVREFEEVQNDLSDIMEELQDDLNVLQYEQRLRAIHRGSAEGEVMMEVVVSVIDYGLYHMDEYGQRWALFLPYTGIRLKFRSKPPVEALKRIMQWAVKDYTQSLVYGWVREYLGNYIDEMTKITENSWELYEEAIK